MIESHFFLLFLAGVGLIALGVGWLTNWDRRQTPARYRYNPAAIQAEILADDTLTDQERAWMKEVEALELPRRHLVC